MKRKFIQPVSMVVTKEQYLELSKELEKLGYERSGSYSNDQFILTNRCMSNYKYGNSGSNNTTCGRYFIDHYNPELFLALAAMSEEDYQVGEYIRYTPVDTSDRHGAIKNEIYKIINTNVYYITTNCDSYSDVYRKNVTKLGKEELIEYFIKIKEKQPNMNKKYVLLQKLPKDVIGTIFEKSTSDSEFYISTNGTKIKTSEIENNPEWFEEKHEFKRGDYVIITGYKDGGANGMGFTKGKVYKLGGDFFNDSNPDFSVEKDDDGESNSWCKVLYRKATPEEIESVSKVKFVKGSWIYVTDTKYDVDYIHEDKAYEVTRDFTSEDKEIYLNSEKSTDDEFDVTNSWLEFREATKEEIEFSKELNSLEVSDYRPKIDLSGKTVSFGCKELDLEDLKAIERVITLKDGIFPVGTFHINNDSINLIKGEEWDDSPVTLEQVQKLIKILDK